MTSNSKFPNEHDPAAASSTPDATADTIAVVINDLPKDLLPENPWPWMLTSENDEWPVMLRSGSDWRQVAFVGGWSQANPVRVIRTIDGQVWAELFERTATPAANRGRSRGGDWVTADDGISADPAVAALVAFARAWTDDQVRSFALALVTVSRDHSKSEIASVIAAVYDLNDVLEKWERRVCALQMLDSTTRATAIALADTWTGELAEFVDAVRDIAAPADARHRPERH